MQTSKFKVNVVSYSQEKQRERLDRHMDDVYFKVEHIEGIIGQLQYQNNLYESEIRRFKEELHTIKSVVSENQKYNIDEHKALFERIRINEENIRKNEEDIRKSRKEIEHICLRLKTLEEYKDYIDSLNSGPDRLTSEKRIAAEARIFYERAEICKENLKYDESEKMYDESMKKYFEFLDIINDDHLRRLSNIWGEFDPEEFKKNMRYTHYAPSRNACQHMKIYIESEHSDKVGEVMFEGIPKKKKILVAPEAR